MSNESPLYEHIIQLVQEKSWLSFADFMHMALYHPQWGYYCGKKTKFGAHGDFITAPSHSPLFSRCIANYVQRFPVQDLWEIGAGNGAMASEIISVLKQEQRLPEHYYIYEISPTLKGVQQQHLRKTHPDYFDHIVWLEHYPASPINGIILANEVIDSLPVHRFSINDDYQLLEQGITLEGDRLDFAYRSPQSPGLALAIDELQQTLMHTLPPGYTSEIHLQLPEWLQSITNCLAHGRLLFIDYGFRRNEYYHWQRYQGTLMCHYQHQAHTDPLIHIGQQDITAHVDFDALANSANLVGCEVSAYSNQADFLMHHGLMDLAEKAMQKQNTHTISQQVNLLTAPHEMGELFKVMELVKNEPTQW